MHPQTIIAGWRKARDACKKKLYEIARDNSEDH